ncbi:MAG: prohibitin family protein [Elusimicrobiales bacterium]|jgi:regulator of protease activity HflC (stomatin/prohibitin superfamily)|nr:prohibitin family protein [Elusimicrobiales bacterium]
MEKDFFEELQDQLKALKQRQGGKMEKDFSGKVLAGMIGLFAVMFLFSAYFIVKPGEVAVKTRLGKIIDSYDEGIKFKLPFLEDITRFSIQIQRADIKSQAFSKDLQTMNVHLVVNHRIQKDTVVSIFRNLGPNYVNSIVDPTVQEIFKSIAAKFSAEKIIGERALLVQEINEAAKVKLMEKEIIVTDISVVDLDFTDQFLKAVEDKQVAEQQAKMAEKLVEKSKREAESMIAKAKGEAESLRLQREQVTTQMIELRKVEAQLKAIDKWNGVLPHYTGGGAVPFISMEAGKTR